MRIRSTHPPVHFHFSCKTEGAPVGFGKPKVRKVQTDHLPGPIATSYRRIFTRHEPDVERLMFILDTAEITARFLGSVVLCTLRELVHEGKLDPPLIDISDPHVRLKKPSFGLWMEILREGARRLHGHGDWYDNDAEQSLAMELSGYVFDERQKTKNRPYSYLDSILVIRNRVHHPSEELDIPALCGEAEELVNRSLEQLQFFEEHTLYVVKQINLKRRRLSTPEYQHQCFLLQGEIDFPAAENDDRNWHTETNDVLIYRGETSYLNLDPLFIYIHADEIDKSRGGSSEKEEGLYPGMYGLAGFSIKSAGIVVDYQPLSGGSKPFRTTNRGFRDPRTTSCLNQGVEELLQMLGKNPALEPAES